MLQSWALSFGLWCNEPKPVWQTYPDCWVCLFFPWKREWASCLCHGVNMSIWKELHNSSGDKTSDMHGDNFSTVHNSLYICFCNSTPHFITTLKYQVDVNVSPTRCCTPELRNSCFGVFFPFSTDQFLNIPARQMEKFPFIFRHHEAIELRKR